MNKKEKDEIFEDGYSIAESQLEQLDSCNPYDYNTEEYKIYEEGFNKAVQDFRN